MLNVKRVSFIFIILLLSFSMLGCSDERTLIIPLSTDNLKYDSTRNVLLETININNTIIETEFYCGEVNANSLNNGDVTKFLSTGRLSVASASDSVTLRFKVGGVTKQTFILTPKVVNDEIWDIHAQAITRTIGVLGQRATHIHFDVGGQEEIFDGVGTLDTTSNMNLTITAQWNNAKTGNIFIINQGLMEFKKNEI